MGPQSLSPTFNMTRKVLTKMIIVNKKPLRFVESRLFNMFCRALQKAQKGVALYDKERVHENI